MTKLCPSCQMTMIIVSDISEKEMQECPNPVCDWCYEEPEPD